MAYTKLHREEPENSYKTIYWYLTGIGDYARYIKSRTFQGEKLTIAQIVDILEKKLGL
jgi:hypothetical protein